MQQDIEEDPVESHKTSDPFEGLEGFDEPGSSDDTFTPYRPLSPHFQHAHHNLTRRRLAFAQTCKQIRSEYRPIWLSNSSVHVHIDVLNDFIRAFYPAKNDYHYAPKELIVSYRYSYSTWNPRAEPNDLTLLVRLHAHCPVLSCSYLPHQINEDHRKECPYKDCFI